MFNVVRPPSWQHWAACLVMSSVSFICADGRAQSIWAQRDPWRAFKFSDTGARRVGDLLTIIVRESTDVANKDQRKLDKDTAAGLKFDFSSSSDSGSASAKLDTTNESNRKFDGSSQYSVAQQFTDHITARIIEVLPNGTFRVAGQRIRNVSGEVRQLTVSGIVRPMDISPDNMVESRFIADFQIQYTGNGAESRFTNQGWLGRIGNKVWPF